MLYILAALLGFMLGFILKGSFKNLICFNIKHKWAFISAFIIQITYQVLCARYYNFLTEYSLYVQAVVFILLLTGFWLNNDLLGSVITGIGSALNAVTMLMNNGKMPVNAEIIDNIMQNEVLKSALLSDGKHTLANESTRLKLFIDNIHLTGFFGQGMRIVSIGDLIVVAGIFILVMELTLGRGLGIKKGKQTVKR